MKTIELGHKLAFTYNVIPGAVEKSFGISLIDHMGFPKEIVN